MAGPTDPRIVALVAAIVAVLIARATSPSVQLIPLEVTNESSLRAEGVGICREFDSRPHRVHTAAVQGVRFVNDGTGEILVPSVFQVWVGDRSWTSPEVSHVPQGESLSKIYLWTGTPISGLRPRPIARGITRCSLKILGPETLLEP